MMGGKYPQFGDGGGAGGSLRERVGFTQELWPVGVYSAPLPDSNLGKVNGAALEVREGEEINPMVPGSCQKEA